MSDAQAVRTPPQSLEAERSVLGALLIDHNGWDKVADKLMATDFYHPAHQIIFTVIGEQGSRGKPFDALIIADRLKTLGQVDEIGGEAYLFKLANETPTSANVASYADIVKEQAQLRCLLEVGKSITEFAYQPKHKSVTELMGEVEQKLFQVTQTSGQEGPQEINQVLAIATEKIDRLSQSDGDVTGVPSGFKDLDKMTSGLHEGDLIIVAGRPSMGKTVLGANIAEHVALRSEKPVLFFSLEMPNEAVAMRMLSSLGRVNQQRLRTGKMTEQDWPRLTSAVSMLSEAKLLIDDTPALSPTEMRARARRMARKHGQLGLIVVDYLQLMRVPSIKDNRVQEISEISRSLKAIAKELNTPVIALSQLNRGLEQRQDKRPVMSDLRESGAIEQDADLIMMIYRDEVYHPDSEQKGVAEIIIGKHRNGPIGTINLTFMGEFTCFDNYASPSYEGVEAL